MAYELNKKLKGIEPYSPINENYAVRLDANESCFNIGDKLGDVIADAVRNIDFNRYPDSAAELVTKGFADFYGISPEKCTAGNGSDELISVILGAFLEKGDTVLTLSPDFSMYAFYGYVDELKIKALHKEDDLTVDIQKVIDCCNNNNVKAVIFSNPCNPTSLGVSRNDIIKLIKNVFCLVVIDEAYMDFWDQSLINEVEKYSNLIIFRTASKAVGSAALRLGFAVANETISRAVKAVKSPYNVNTFSQVVGSIIYKNKDYLKNRQKTIVRNREKLYNDLLELSALSDDFKVYNSCANFVFVKTSFGKDLWNYLKDNSIVIRFMGDYIRISVGTEEENEELISCIKTYLSR